MNRPFLKTTEQIGHILKAGKDADTISLFEEGGMGQDRSKPVSSTWSQFIKAFNLEFQNVDPTLEISAVLSKDSELIN